VVGEWAGKERNKENKRDLLANLKTDGIVATAAAVNKKKRRRDAEKRGEKNAEKSFADDDKIPKIHPLSTLRAREERACATRAPALTRDAE